MGITLNILAENRKSAKNKNSIENILINLAKEETKATSS